MRAIKQIGKNKSRGVSIVEFAILLPVLVMMFCLFWDLLVRINLETRQASAAFQLTINFKNTPIRAVIATDADTAETQIDIRQLSASNPNELTADGGLLYEFNELYYDAMAASGTFADQIEYNIAVRLLYFCIYDASASSASSGCPDVPDAVKNKVPSASGYTYAVDGENTFIVAAGETFFTSPGPDGGNANTCFGAPESAERIKIEDQFDKYVEGKISQIIPSRSPFGTLVLDVFTGIPRLANLESYLPWKAMLVYTMCAKAPRFFEEDAIITQGFHFFDHEVAISTISS